MALNKVMLIGNVGNDPEIRYLDSNPQGPQGNAKVASFRLATTERYRDRNGETRENTEWHNIVAWRSNADVIEKFVHKGSQIYVEGKLRTRKWTDRDGKDRYTTEIQVDNLQLLGKRPDREGDGQGGYGGQQGGYSGSGQGGYSGGGQGGYSGPGYGGQQPQASRPQQCWQQPAPQQGGYQQPAQGGFAPSQGAPQPYQPASQPSAPYQAPAPQAQPVADAGSEDDLPF